MRDTLRAVRQQGDCRGVGRGPIVHPNPEDTRGLDQGINRTASLASYLIPSALDVPDIEPLIVESGDGQGPLGARGIGEAPIGPPAAAVANASADATGARVAALPLTPERGARAVHSTPEEDD